MKAKKLLIILTASLFFISKMAFAADLLQVFFKAVHSDPIFSQSESTWLSEKENLPIAQAQYLPRLDISGQIQRNIQNAGSGNIRNPNHNWQVGFNMTVTQPVFNVANWAAIKQANATVKSATASYLYSIQDLMARTATAYFSVLQAYDKLRYTLANKRAVYRQLVTVEQQFKVGLVAITGVYDAQSRYDQTIADEISDRINLYNQLENLRAITGVFYHNLRGIGYEVPLISPKPVDMNAWVNTAEGQNYNIIAQRYSVLAAHDNIQQQSAGDYPTVNLLGNYSSSDNSGNASVPGSDTFNSNVQLSADLPLYQGGAVIASTRQARYDYLTASAKLEQTHRDVVTTTRQSYLGVVSGVSQVKADKQSIKSARNALKATEAGYIVGTRTMVDVLNDLSTLYQTQQQFADDQYAYINSIIALKEAAGTLSVGDLRQINAWLHRTVKFPISQAYYSSAQSRYSETQKTAGGIRDEAPSITSSMPSSRNLLNSGSSSITTPSVPAPGSSSAVSPMSSEPTTIPSTSSTVPSSSVPTPSTMPSPVQTTPAMPAPSATTPTPKTMPAPSQTTTSPAPQSLPSPSSSNTKTMHKNVFAVQLYASPMQTKAIRFASRLPSKMQPMIINQDGHYKVIVGKYASILAAHEAIEKLPMQFKQGHPWVVSLNARALG